VTKHLSLFQNNTTPVLLVLLVLLVLVLFTDFCKAEHTPTSPLQLVSVPLLQ
jgi:hypothetical protein